MQTTRPSLASSEGAGGESSYRDLVHKITVYEKDNDLVLNIDKTKEFILDFRRRAHPLQPLTIKGTVVERTDSYKFLSLHMSESFSWAKNTTTTAKRAQQRPHFIRVLGCQPLIQACGGLVESVLTITMAVWYRSTTLADRKSQQRVIRAAERVTDSGLPSMDAIYTQRCRWKVQSILRDKHRPAHALFQWVDSGHNVRHRRPVNISARRARFHKSFFPTTVRLVAQDIKEGRSYLTPQLTPHYR